TLWVWWASRVQDGDAGPLVTLLLVCGIVAALARWATYLHGTGAPALVLTVVLVYTFATRDSPPAGFAGDGAAEATGALLTVATGLAALVLVRARELWTRLVAGAVTLGLAW